MCFSLTTLQCISRMLRSPAAHCEMSFVPASDNISTSRSVTEWWHHASKVIREVANGPNEHSVHEALGHRASLIRINPYRHLKAHEFAGTSMACCVLFSSAHLTAGFRWNFHQENNRSYYFDLVNWLYFGYQSVQRIHLFLLNQREDKQV